MPERASLAKKEIVGDGLVEDVPLEDKMPKGDGGTVSTAMR